MMARKQTSKTKKTDPVWVYVNPYFGIYLDNPEVKKFLDERLDTTDWTGFSNDMQGLSDFFGENDVDESSLLSGIALCQFQSSIKGGTTVNAALFGLVIDTARWSRIFQENKDNITLKFLNVPYEFYKAIAKRKAVDKKEYDAQNKTMKDALMSCPTYVSETIH